jgi:FAD/FMN-containing dehydrogenase
VPAISSDIDYLGDVGVAGLTLGGGLSFLSAEYGLVCDNVVNYEVVLADASIVNANAFSNTDLYWALKGGGNQFGESVQTHLKRQSLTECQVLSPDLP